MANGWGLVHKSIVATLGNEKDVCTSNRKTSNKETMFY